MVKKAKLLADEEEAMAPLQSTGMAEEKEEEEEADDLSDEEVDAGQELLDAVKANDPRAVAEAQRLCRYAAKGKG